MSTEKKKITKKDILDEDIRIDLGDNDKSEGSVLDIDSRISFDGLEEA